MTRTASNADQHRSTADIYWTEKATEPAPTSGLLAIILMAVIVLAAV